MATECNEVFSGDQLCQYRMNFHFRDCLCHHHHIIPWWQRQTVSITVETHVILTQLTVWEYFIECNLIYTFFLLVQTTYRNKIDSSNLEVYSPFIIYHALIFLLLKILCFVLHTLSFLHKIIRVTWKIQSSVMFICGLWCNTEICWNHFANNCLLNHITGLPTNIYHLHVCTPSQLIYDSNPCTHGSETAYLTIQLIHLHWA
jgi:hypothetical protein